MKRQTILVLDDEQELKDELSFALKERGFKVLNATGCQEAAEIIAKNEPDVAIIDKRLPDGDGLEWIGDFKRASKGTIFILLTGFGDFKSAMSGYASGLDDYFEKPPDMEKLLGRIDELLAQKEKKPDIAGTMSNIAHEIINPLTVIKESISCAKDGLTGPITDETKNMLDISVRQISRLANFTEGMIDSDLIEKGKFPFHPREVMIGPIIKDMTDGLKADFIKYNLKVDLDINDNLKTVYMDDDLFAHVFFNLAHNAIKYTPHGKAIHILAKRVNGAFYLSIRDEGPGIPDVDQEEIFKKYHQSGKKQKKSRGIGLFIVQQIVEMHGGDVCVESSPGHGSTFTVKLPLKPTDGRGGHDEESDDSGR